ncbi:MAG TPA: hypothetical protein VNO43_11195 [Candidatus Eisenbacteria bacterium]|nr:hypothetical protein [Candidatus Eisenbacteria bacterium]
MPRDPSVKRWEISICGRGTVHIHYGTGSLHIFAEDFLSLVADLEKTAEAFSAVCRPDTDLKKDPIQ